MKLIYILFILSNLLLGALTLTEISPRCDVVIKMLKRKCSKKPIPLHFCTHLYSLQEIFCNKESL